VDEEGALYEVHFANGELAFADSLREADTLVTQRMGDVTSPRLLPARIWCMTRDHGSISKLVKTIT
jgi:hypothetical protein